MALSGQRLRVLDYVRAHSPVRVTDAAGALGLHANTVREHLDAVVTLGLVERSTARTAGRGRPATLYRVSAADPAVAVRDYAGLATALAGQLARTSAQPERDARAAGVEWGRELLDERNHAGGDARQAVLEALARLGFAPEASRCAAVRCWTRPVATRPSSVRSISGSSRECCSGSASPTPRAWTSFRSRNPAPAVCSSPIRLCGIMTDRAFRSGGAG